ncbi:MAG: PAS domain-containing protein [Acidobacteria bacterium]|nr:PAS domain-containing protein [Acidobacteriota bacterium]
MSNKWFAHKYRIYILGGIITLSILSLIAMNLFLAASNRELKQIRDQALDDVAARQIYLELDHLLQPDEPSPDLSRIRDRLYRLFVKEELLALHVVSVDGRSLFSRTAVQLSAEMAEKMTPAALQTAAPAPEEILTEQTSVTGRRELDVLLGRAVLYSPEVRPRYYVFFMIQDPRPPVMNTLEQMVMLCQTIFVLSLLVLVWTILRKSVRPYEKLISEIKAAPSAASPERASEFPDEISFLVGSFKSVIDKLQEKEKELESMHRQAKERAASSEKFARDVLAGIHLSIISLDENGTFLEGNEALEDLLGRKRIAWRNLHYGEIFQNSPPLKEAIDDFYGDPRPLFREALPLTPPAGESLVVDLHLSPLTDPHGVFYGMIGVLEDVTESVQLRQKMQTRENLAALGEMAAGIAHEFKNSLATISGYAQLLHGNARPGAETKRTAAVIQEVEELVRVISDFMEYARPIRTEKAPLSLDEVLREVLDAFSERHPEIEFRRELVPAVIHGEKALLKKAFQNLILNSVQALQRQKTAREKRVEVRMEFPTGRLVGIQITDTGPGLDTRHLSRIFTPFFTTRPEGTGLGLAVVQKIVHAHEGTVEVWSEPGRGFGALIRLPLAPDTSRPTTG